MELLFDHSDFLLVAKPAGVSFHSEDGAGFVVDVQRTLGTVFPVHRLDKMTSGLVLFAKSAETARELGVLFERRTIEKYYLAISLRKPKKKQGWVKGDMLRSRRGSWKLAKTTDSPAITRFVSAALRPGERAFLIRPYTGKTHQIRVALKSIGTPIAGDRRYADTAEAAKEERGYLHAYALRFHYKAEAFAFVYPPQTGERFTSEAFQRKLERWSAPWKII